MKIYISELTFETIVGVLDFERLKPQKVIIDFECNYEYDTNNYLDYVKIINFIKDEMNLNKYELLEEACIDLSKKIKNKFKEIKNLKIKITKPEIILNVKVSLEWSL